MIKGQLSEGLGRGGAFFVCEKCRVNVVWLFTSYRQVKKLCIRETADATGYHASQFARIQALYKKLNLPEKLS